MIAANVLLELSLVCKLKWGSESQSLISGCIPVIASCVSKKRVIQDMFLSFLICKITITLNLHLLKMYFNNWIMLKMFYLYLGESPILIKRISSNQKCAASQLSFFLSPTSVDCQHFKYMVFHLYLIPFSSKYGTVRHTGVRVLKFDSHTVFPRK